MRIKELDGIRGLAILLVLVLHYLSLPVPDGAGGMLGFFKVLTGRLMCGVDLFFVLSGFLIASILLENRGAPHYFSAFYVRRACRILPLYLGAVALYWAALWIPTLREGRFDFLMRPELPEWTYLTFTQNFWMAKSATKGAEWLSVTWSLAVEEQFYLLLPLLIALLPKRAVSWTPIWNADCMAAGVVMAIIWRDSEQIANLRNRLSPWLLQGTIFTGVLCMGWLSLNPGFLTSYGVHPLARLLYVGEKTVWVVTFSLLLATPLLFPATPVGAFLRTPMLRWLGTYSYGIYLIHQPAHCLLHGFILNQAPRLASPTDFGVSGIAMAVTLAIAIASFHWFESPILAWGHRFKYRPPSQTPAS
jgi:peptidoglycan/LPS O-acetylase OafA/YrhL